MHIYYAYYTFMVLIRKGSWKYLSHCSTTLANILCTKIQQNIKTGLAQVFKPVQTICAHHTFFITHLRPKYF
jgi:hypothetical protein